VRSCAIWWTDNWTCVWHVGRRSRCRAVDMMEVMVTWLPDLWPLVTGSLVSYDSDASPFFFELFACNFFNVKSLNLYEIALRISKALGNTQAVDSWRLPFLLCILGIMSLFLHSHHPRDRPGPLQQTLFFFKGTHAMDLEPKGIRTHM